MKLHIFPGKDKSSATARYRAFLLGEYLQNNGAEAVVCDPPVWRSAFSLTLGRFREFIKNFRILWNTEKQDMLYLVRTMFQIDFFLLILFYRLVLGKDFVFDFDDTIYLKDFGKKRAEFFTKYAKGVVVANHHIAKWARKRNDNVYIVPTSVPFKLYQKHSKWNRPQNEEFTIGWIGNGKNHVKNLKLVIPAIKQLIKDGFEFRIVLIGAMGHEPFYDLFNDIEGLNVEFIDHLKWEDPESSPRAIQQFDVGLMPLVEDPKTLGKSAFKAIEYMACGVPVVLSPVGENQHLVNESENGFFASSTEDWVQKIKALKDRDLARKVGQAGQQTVKENYSLEANVPRLLNFIKSL